MSTDRDLYPNTSPRRKVKASRRGTVVRTEGMTCGTQDESSPVTGSVVGSKGRCVDGRVRLSEIRGDAKATLGFLAIPINWQSSGSSFYDGSMR